MTFCRRLTSLPTTVGRLMFLCGISLFVIVNYNYILDGSRTQHIEISKDEQDISRNLLSLRTNRSFQTNIRTSPSVNFETKSGSTSTTESPSSSTTDLPSTTSNPPPYETQYTYENQWETYATDDQRNIASDNHYTMVRQSEVLEMIRASSGKGNNSGNGTKLWYNGRTIDRIRKARRTYNRTRHSLPAAVMADTEVSYNVSSEKLCPAVPPGLVDLIPIFMDSPSFDSIEERHPELLPGGFWTPINCTARHRVALIVPYRDREQHLRTFLAHMHPFLQKQQLEYAIYIVEQTDTSPFNRAMLFNIGFVMANKLHQWDCYIFHDVDLLPENDRNLYSCPKTPRHMSVGVDKFGYRLPYATIFGGVSAMRKEHFEKVNGFANTYFGWGAEDDDMSFRLKHHGLPISRYPVRIGRYKMLSHIDADKSAERFGRLQVAEQRIHKDGINSLKYKLEAVKQKALFTQVIVTINQSEVMADFPELKRRKSRTEQPPVLSLDNAAAEVEHVSRLIRQRINTQKWSYDATDGGNPYLRMKAKRPVQRTPPDSWKPPEYWGAPVYKKRSPHREPSHPRVPGVHWETPDYRIPPVHKETPGNMATPVLEEFDGKSAADKEVNTEPPLYRESSVSREPGRKPQHFKEYHREPPMKSNLNISETPVHRKQQMKRRRKHKRKRKT